MRNSTYSQHIRASAAEICDRDSHHGARTVLLVFVLAANMPGPDYAAYVVATTCA
jgi:hypothetical protein